MTNDGDGKKTSSSMAVAIVLPSLFAIILVLLLAVTFLLPRLTKPESESEKAERRNKRLARLDACARSQPFVDWAEKQRKDDPEAAVTVNPLCVICLDEVEDTAQIRPLGCRHIFHQECLDDWFARWNEYCPLCHRPIVPGSRERRLKEAPVAVAVLLH